MHSIYGVKYALGGEHWMDYKDMLYPNMNKILIFGPYRKWPRVVGVVEFDFICLCYKFALMCE